MGTRRPPPPNGRRWAQTRRTSIIRSRYWDNNRYTGLIGRISNRTLHKTTPITYKYKNTPERSLPRGLAPRSCFTVVSSVFLLRYEPLTLIRHSSNVSIAWYLYKAQQIVENPPIRSVSVVQVCRLYSYFQHLTELQQHCKFCHFLSMQYASCYID